MFRIGDKRPVFSAAGEGAAAPPEEGEANTEGTEGQAGEQPQDTGQSSILDMASGEKPEQQEGEAWTPPEDVPEHLRGETPDDTIKKLMTAYQGARRDISQGRKPATDGTVPDSPDGYEIAVEGDDDKIGAELTSEASKPIVDAFRAAAHKQGLTAEQFQAFMRDGMSQVAEQGFPIGASDDEAQQISAEAEMEKLTEIAGGQQQANTIINTVGTYAEKLVNNGVITQDDLAEFRQMAGTAESAQLFYRIITSELGEKPIPMPAAGEGSVSATDAYASYEAAMRIEDPAQREAAMADAQSKMQRAFGGKQAGSVRSNVL